MRKVVAFVGIAALGLAWAVMPASAEGAGSFSSTPEAGPPGTVIHVVLDNATCENRNDVLVVNLIDVHDDVIASASATNGNGQWPLDLTVPDDALPGLYSVEAHCPDFGFDPNSFTVTGSPETTTTTTATTTTTTVGPLTVTTSTTVPPAEVAVTATPVVASPALAG